MQLNGVIFKMNYKIFLGYEGNKPFYIDLLKNNYHWLIAGSTGSGKSVFLKNVIESLLKDNNNLFYFIDLKRVELAKYQKLKNCITFCNDAENVTYLLNDIIKLMQERYKKYEKSGVVSYLEYNEKIKNTEKNIFLIIDELADLFIINKEAKTLLQRILQLGRASGIYVLAATQRPSSDIIPGLLKVNFTTRFCFRVASSHDSRVILDEKGGETLTKPGECLVKLGTGEVKHVQMIPPKNENITIYNGQATKKYNVKRFFSWQHLKKYINIGAFALGFYNGYKRKKKSNIDILIKKLMDK